MAAAPGRGSRCLVLVPEHLSPAQVELVRAYRQGVVAWSGRVPHFTAGMEGAGGERRCRLHVLGDDPRRSVYALGRKRRASLAEDFWPAAFDVYRARTSGGMDGDETVVTPQAARPVWAALEAGVAVEPQDIVVVILPAEAPADLDDPAPSPPLHRRRARAAFRGAVGAVLSVAVLLLGVLTAVAVTPSFLGDSNRPAPSGAGRVAGARPATFDAYAALARSADVTVYERPDSGSSPVRSFPAVGDYGARQTFLIEREQPLPDGVWYEVLLPVRPNGTKGWVRGSDVEVAGLPYRIKVHLGSLRLELYRDGRLERTFPIGIGTGDTPTPPGRYSIRYLMRPDDQNTLYGHYVYGLSGFSDVVRDVPGGGELGIHGTNDPNGSIGNRVSQGCIRLRNEDIASLVPLLPLGTPVDVVDDRPPPKNQ